MITLSQSLLPHGITLSCRSAGEIGRPVLMFLHGFPEAAFVWDDLLEFFSQPANGGYRCIAPNLRGFERSSAPTEVSAYRPKHLVQDITALIALETAGGPSARLACLVAHDWGGAVAWNLAASQPQWLDKLVIINSPHPATFLRELQHSPAQQAASAYMNFLVRPDAETLLAANDFARMWPFFTAMGAAEGLDQWLTAAVKAQYRAVWLQGLTGALNYYRASPLRPARDEAAVDGAANPAIGAIAPPATAATTLPRELLEVKLPTLVIWGLNDKALLPGLLDGLKDYVPRLQLEQVPGASHWILHEKPAVVRAHVQAFITSSMQA